MASIRNIEEARKAVEKYNGTFLEKTGYYLEGLEVVVDRSSLNPYILPDDNKRIYIPSGIVFRKRIRHLSDHHIVHEIAHLLLNRENPNFVNKPEDMNIYYYLILSEGFAEYAALDFFLDSYPPNVQKRASRTALMYRKMASDGLTARIYRALFYGHFFSPEHVEGYCFFHRLAETRGRTFPFDDIRNLHLLSKDFEQEILAD